jgi:hypothetical protein
MMMMKPKIMKKKKELIDSKNKLKVVLGKEKQKRQPLVKRVKVFLLFIYSSF